MAEITCNKPHMRLWTAGLRSGEYPQGKGILQGRNGKFCCLGVACRIAIANGLTIEVNDGCTCSPGCSAYSNFSFNGCDTLLPTAVREWLGLPYEDPVIGFDVEANHEITAVHANDSLNWDFEKIADAIDEYYKLNEPDDD